MAGTPFVTFLLIAGSLVSLVVFYLTTWDNSEDLSLQGCRMSWMSPSYVLQDAFNSSWTPLAERYSLFLYREVGWEINQVSEGTPVLFIPGNAGSSHQVRSIASSAARQYYTSPYVVAPEFLSRHIKPLDFFAAEFNEDLSAYHGPTLDSQIAYTSRAISYILSLYPPGTSIIVMGHSMGGIVATSLLPSPNISAIITMSTPHTLPPVRFDFRIDKIYAHNQLALDADPTPILSLCGGATDMMITSEYCILPHNLGGAFRRTVFTSALEGAWTGVGHREMVWCHQVRWRVARAALELGSASSSRSKGEVLDRWLRDGHTLPPAPLGTAFTLENPDTYQTMQEATHLVAWGKYIVGTRTFLLPLPPAKRLLTTPLKAVVLVLGSISSVHPQRHLPLRVTVHTCFSSQVGPECNPLHPDVVKLVPNPFPDTTFPVPDQGTDETEGVVVFEADLPAKALNQSADRNWLGIHVEDGDGRSGWVVGGIALEREVVEAPTLLSLIFKNITVAFPDKTALRTRFIFPNLLSHALLVYRYTPVRPQEAEWCPDPIVAPLISHTSHTTETHYHPVNKRNGKILLHTHSPAPYVRSNPPRRALEFVLYSSGNLGCNMDGFTITIDWEATLGRFAQRYLMTVVSWAVGIVALVLFTAWQAADRSDAVPSLKESLSHFDSKIFPKLSGLSLVIALLPLPIDYYIGTEGEPFFAPIAPLLFLVATGLVLLSWLLLVCLMWPVGIFSLLFSRRYPRLKVHENVGVRRSTILSMGVIFALILTFIPWQVAYLGCWLIHLSTCAVSTRLISSINSSSVMAIPPVPSVRPTEVDGTVEEVKEEEAKKEKAQSGRLRKCLIDNHNHNMHLLLLMTWLLPFVAPVLAVWVRTLMTAGWSTPFGGDHDILNVAPFLVLIDFASWNTNVLFERHRFERVFSMRWLFAAVAGIAFFVGPKKTYSVFDAAKITIGVIVLVRVGRRYWGASPWSSEGSRL